MTLEASGSVGVATASSLRSYFYAVVPCPFLLNALKLCILSKALIYAIEAVFQYKFRVLANDCRTRRAASPAMIIYAYNYMYK